MTQITNQRHRFDLPDDLAYFDCGYMSPLSRRTLTAGHAALDTKARPWVIRPNDFLETPGRARERFAQLLGPPASPNDVALVPSVSYAMATAASNLPLPT